MEFLLLWSGDIRGARKCRISGVTSKGIVGHWHNGALYVPDAEQVREALPFGHRASFDKWLHFNGLPQLWCDARDNNKPLVMRLLNSRGKLMATYYFQPLTQESN